MIKKIRIQNFMSLKNTTIELGPLNIFIGPNASGKSAIFKALRFLSQLMIRPLRGPLGDFTLEPTATLDYLVWQGNSGLPIIFEVWFEDSVEELPNYRIEIRKESRGWSVFGETINTREINIDTKKKPFTHNTEKRGVISWGENPYRASLVYLIQPYIDDEAALHDISPLLIFKEQLGRYYRYRISANDIAAFAQQDKKYFKSGSEEIFVRDNGWGLSLALQELLGRDRQTYEKIEQELNSIFPHIKSINVQNERFGTGISFTTNRSEDLLPASQESDGVLLTLFLLWRLYTAPSNIGLCFEEPENGMHPYFLKTRYELFNKFSIGSNNKKRAQISVATHSINLLCAIEDKKELINVVKAVEFSSEDGTHVYSLRDIKHINTLIDSFNGNIGELWWSGAIGAIPT